MFALCVNQRVNRIISIKIYASCLQSIKCYYVCWPVKFVMLAFHLNGLLQTVFHVYLFIYFVCVCGGGGYFCISRMPNNIHT